jgi:hypothetical protein
MGAMDSSDLSDSDESEPKNEEDGIFRETLDICIGIAIPSESGEWESPSPAAKRNAGSTAFDQKATPVVVTRDIIITSKKPVEPIRVNDVELNGDVPTSSSNSEERSTGEFASVSRCYFAVPTMLALVFCSADVAAGWYCLAIHHYSAYFRDERHSR